MNNMIAKHNQKWYLKKCRDCLLEIEKLPQDQIERFHVLQKKAKKYLEKAKEFEKA